MRVAEGCNVQWSVEPKNWQKMSKSLGKGNGRVYKGLSHSFRCANFCNGRQETTPLHTIDYLKEGLLKKIHAKSSAVHCTVVPKIIKPLRTIRRYLVQWKRQHRPHRSTNSWRHALLAATLYVARRQPTVLCCTLLPTTESHEC